MSISRIMLSRLATIARPNIQRMLPLWKPREIHTLHKLNNLFLQSYALRKERVKMNLGTESPVILINGDHLTLLYKGKRQQITYMPEKYNVLKSIAHISCLIHTLSSLKEKEELRSKCANSIEELLAMDGVNKYKPILKQYRHILKQEDPARELPALKSSLMELIDESAKCRLEALHNHVEKIRKSICPQSWENLSVVVMGPPMPRDGEVSMQYFRAKLLPPGAERCAHLQSNSVNEGMTFSGKKIIYAESIYEEDKALDLLTTQICDEVMGEDLLGDKSIMHSDLLKDAAQKYLDKL